MRRGPGRQGGYDPLASLRKGSGGRGPPLSSRGQDKEDKEGIRRRRAPSLIEKGARRRGVPTSPRRRKKKKGKFDISYFVG